MHIGYLEDGRKILISTSKFEILHLTKDGKEEPTLYAVVLTEEMENVIRQGNYGLSA